jgi:hypothetical protein
MMASYFNNDGCQEKERKGAQGISKWKRRGKYIGTTDSRLSKGLLGDRFNCYI